MRSFAAVIVGLWLATACSAAVTSAKETTPKKSASKQAPKRVAQKPPTRGQTTAVKKAARKTSRSRAKPGWRTSQQTPAPERYREIQQALIEKGYLAGPATGTWSPESIEALKRFEQAQNLNPDGKLDSLALIALGLGPRRDTSAAPAAPNPASQPNPRSISQPGESPNEDRRSP